MKGQVLIGSSIPMGLDQVKLHKRIKQGDIILTMLPREKTEALAVARYCRDNGIYLVFSELLHRGSYDFGKPYRTVIPRDEYYTKAELDEIIDAAGAYYYGRVTIGEIGGVAYWPKAYTIDRRVNNYVNLPPCRTASQARDAYVAYCKQWLDYERNEVGKGLLMNVESSMLFKYHVMAGLDVLCLEVMPGDPHLMHAALRGAAKAFDKPWGTHIAMQCYGGVCFDELYQKRWRTSVFYSWLTGAEFIYPESGHYTYTNQARQKAVKFETKEPTRVTPKQTFGFSSPEMKRVRAVIREAWQFARIHQRPANGPKVTLGVLHGHLDGSPGLWNRYFWGQYDDAKWIDGPATHGWRFVDKFHRKEDWPSESVQGEVDFSGNPPYGQYDAVPIEAALEKLQSYSCLVCLGWNTMTPEIYKKLKAYVRAGGRLVMFLPQLSTHETPDGPLKLFRKGDYSDLFGVKIKGAWPKDVRGVNCMADSAPRVMALPALAHQQRPALHGRVHPREDALHHRKGHHRVGGLLHPARRGTGRTRRARGEHARQGQGVAGRH